MKQVMLVNTKDGNECFHNSLLIILEINLTVTNQNIRYVVYLQVLKKKYRLLKTL